MKKDNYILGFVVKYSFYLCIKKNLFTRFLLNFFLLLIYQIHDIIVKSHTPVISIENEQEIVLAYIRKETRVKEGKNV